MVKKNMFYVIFFLLGCNTLKKTEVTIKGENINIPKNRVYLTDSYNWDVYIDSAEVRDGKFMLYYKSKKPFEPFKASIAYYNSAGQISQLYIKNNYLIEKDGKNHAISSFILEPGKSTLTGTTSTTGSYYVNWKGGPQTKLFLEQQGVSFGHIIDSIPRVKQLTEKKAFIKENSYSFHLLEQISTYREEYTNSELRELLSTFNKRTQQLSLAQELGIFIKNRPELGEKTKNLNLFNVRGEKKEQINKVRNLNMLVFWASWCGPCLKEIPELKEIFKKHNARDFYMASISIDEKRDEWIKALNQHGMQWDQFLINSVDLTRIKAEYNFSLIPLVVFTDITGKEVARFSGHTSERIKEYTDVIVKHLK